MITASRFTDSADPDPFRPRLTSLRSGVRPKMTCMICGPLAPIRPSKSAPPIHSAKGPKMLMRPSRKKLETTPSPLPLASNHVSATANIPNRKANQCNQRFGSATWDVFRTPSSISSSMKRRARLRPNNSARPSVVTAVNTVAPTESVGLTSKSPVLNSMKPTAESTTGTASKASKYPASHATDDITKSSSRTMPCRLCPSAPITRWMLTSRRRCSKERTSP